MREEERGIGERGGRGREGRREKERERGEEEGILYKFCVHYNREARRERGIGAC